MFRLAKKNKKDRKGSKVEKNTNEVIFTIALPGNIIIELVPANELKSYELFTWLIVLVSPIASSFWTSAYSTPVSERGSLVWSASIFTIISCLFLILAVIFRLKMKRNGVQRSANLSSFK